jgi:hypothetical protein
MLLMHPVDYASLVGVRRTRAGRWVWRGRTYRTRALAMRRVPIRVMVAGIEAVMCNEAKRGTAYAMKPSRFEPFAWEPERSWDTWESKTLGFGFGLNTWWMMGGMMGRP